MFSKFSQSSHGSRSSSLTAKVAVLPMAIGTLASLGMLAGQASANMIANGEFSANAAAYTHSPGSDYNGNPAVPTGWTGFYVNANVGINGPDTGFYGSSGGYEPFAPASTAGVRDFLFLQNSGGYSFQTVATTTGQGYTLSYDGAARAGETSDVLKVILTNAIDNSQITSQTPAISDAGFNPFTLNFTAPSASTTVEFLNNNGSNAAGGTVDVTDVGLTAAVVPEPATLGLFAVGGMGLLLAARSRKTRV
ncbi:MAG: PEP-CTERM sorting domain-containing protein [Phycisphaerae bacterium]